MKSVYIVICNAGDGSNYLEWHKTMDEDKQTSLLEGDLERYGSGDGFQLRELQFPDDFDLESFINLNRIYLYEDEFEDE